MQLVRVLINTVGTQSAGRMLLSQGMIFKDDAGSVAYDDNCDMKLQSTYVRGRLKREYKKRKQWHLYEVQYSNAHKTIPKQLLSCIGEFTIITNYSCPELELANSKCLK